MSSSERAAALTPTRVPYVLVAEDDAELRALLRAELEEGGYAVGLASSASQVLEALLDASRWRARTPDVIVSDVRMPGQSGLDLLLTLQRARWTIPVILITAFGDAGLHAEATRRGAAAVLDKPFDVDDLRATIARVVRVVTP